MRVGLSQRVSTPAAQGLPASFQAPTKPGKYAFHCFHHPYMTGVLTVS
jgi:hypothetical protein